jgi:hypothetical protein
VLGRRLTYVQVSQSISLGSSKQVRESSTLTRLSQSLGIFVMTVGTIFAGWGDLNFHLTS